MNTQYKIESGFKVITEVNDELLSEAWWYYDFAIKYIVGEWVKPHSKCGPLAVLSNLEDTLNYWLRVAHPRKQIWHCEYKKSNCTALYTPDSLLPLSRCHSGTILAWEVKLIKPYRNRKRE